MEGRSSCPLSPHLSQEHLWLAYLQQHMLKAPGISSEIHRAGKPAAGEPLPSFLQHVWSLLTRSPQGCGTGTAIASTR